MLLLPSSNFAPISHQVATGKPRSEWQQVVVTDFAQARMFIGCIARFERPCYQRPVCVYEGTITGVTVSRYCVTVEVDVYNRCGFAVDEQTKFDIQQFVAILVTE